MSGDLTGAVAVVTGGGTVVDGGLVALGPVAGS